MPILVAIGDSVCAGEGDTSAQGWVSRIRAKLDKSWMVYNLGICGDTIVGAVVRWGEVTYRTPDILIVAIGYNDFKISKKSNERYVGPTLVEDGWRFMIQNIKQLNKPTLVVLPWLGEDIVSARSIFRKQDAEAYVEQAKAVLDNAGIPYVQAAGLKPEHYIDGVHPNTDGYDIMAEQIYSKLNQLNWM